MPLTIHFGDMATKRKSYFSRRILSLPVAGLLLGMVGCAAPSGENWLANALEPLMPPTPGEAARDAFNVYDADKRRRAVALISASPFGGEAPYLKTYRLLIDDHDATVRAACAKALGMHGSVEDTTLIEPLLRDRVAFVRWEAAQALQRIHNPSVASELMQRVKDDEDADVRMAAAAALGQYPQPAVFDVLLGALVDRDFGVVAAAHQSLVTLTGKEFGYEPADWLAWANDNRDSLFAGQRRYTYMPYDQPPGILDKMQFWREREVPQPQAPTGAEASAGSAAARDS